MKLIYLHGFNSDATGRTAVELKKIFPDELVTISYDYIDPNVAFVQINALIEGLIKSDDEIIISGTSLGGFWALYFATRWGLKCVVTNPSTEPWVSLRAMVGSNKNHNTHEVRELTEQHVADFEKYQPNFKTPLFPLHVLLAKDDDVLDYRIAESKVKGRGIITYITGGHRMGDLTPFIEAVKKMDLLCFD